MLTRQNRLAQEEPIEIMDEHGNWFVIGIDASKFFAIFILKGSESPPFMDDQRIVAALHAVDHNNGQNPQKHNARPKHAGIHFELLSQVSSD
jgi:hypothetical protein